MNRTTRLLAGVAALLLAGGAAAAGDEGGRPPRYRLDGAGAPEFDARPQIEAYAALVHATYAAAHAGAVEMKAAVDAFLKGPTAENLARARVAWINARVPYLQTEAFRFYDGPIDVADPDSGKEGPESRLNAWPLNEGFIDYVTGNPKSGIVNDRRVRIARESIVEHDQVSDEADVTTGWHAIEFLLWGQDLSAVGAGSRPASDYRAGRRNNDRRRLYLKTVTDMLVDDLAGLVAAWEPDRPGSYAVRFRALDQREALLRILTGAATLAGFEMKSERLSVALDSGDQEDEHSCFSDNTRNDFVYDLRGIRNVYFGAYGGTAGAGLDELVASIDPALDSRMLRLLNAAEAAVAAIDQPFDRVLAAPKGSPARARAEAAVAALQDLADGFRAVGQRLGVPVVVASH